MGCVESVLMERNPAWSVVRGQLSEHMVTAVHGARDEGTEPTGDRPLLQIDL